MQMAAALPFAAALSLVLLSTRAWAAPFELPSGVGEDHLAAAWEFGSGVSGGWAAASADGQSMETTLTAEGLRLRLIRTHDAAGWIESPPLNITVIDSTFVVVRMKHLGAARVANLSLDFDPSAGARRQALPEWELRGQESRAVALLADGQFHEYAFPVWLAREVVPTRTARLARLRLAPVYELRGGRGAVGTVVVAWVRIIHAPTVTRVTGCVRPRPGAASASPYALASDSGVPIPPFRVFVRQGAGADRFFASADDALAGVGAGGDPSAPYAATLGCAPGGGDRIAIEGRHLGAARRGSRLPIVAVDGRPCTDVVLEKPQTRLTCTVPPGTGRFVPVVVASGDAPVVSDAEPLLSYAPEPTPPRLQIANVGATALDAVLSMPDTFVAATVTGWRIQWRAARWAPLTTRDGVGAGVDDITSSQTVARRVWGHWGDAATGGGNATTGNLTVATIRGLRPNTAYQFRAAAVTALVAASDAWVRTDEYGMLQTQTQTQGDSAGSGSGSSGDGGALSAVSPAAYVAATGAVGPFSSPVEIVTPPFDFFFSHFDANATLDHGAYWPGATVNTALRAGGSGHYGLSLVGSASIANCNSSHVCCDNYGGPGFASRMTRLFAADDTDPAHVPRVGSGGASSYYQWNPSTSDFSPLTWSTAEQTARIVVSDVTESPGSGGPGAGAFGARTAVSPGIPGEIARSRVLVEGGISPSSASAAAAVAAGALGAATAGLASLGLPNSRQRLGEPNDVNWRLSRDAFAPLLAYGFNRHPHGSVFTQRGPAQLWEGFDDGANVVYVPLSAITAAEERARLEQERNATAADYLFGLDAGDPAAEGAVRPRRRGVFYDRLGRRMVPASVHPASLCTLACAAPPHAAGGSSRFNGRAVEGDDGAPLGDDAGSFARPDGVEGAADAAVATGLAGVRALAVEGGSSLYLADASSSASASSARVDAARRGGEGLLPAGAAWEYDMRSDVDDDERAARIAAGLFVTGRARRSSRGVGADRGGSGNAGDVTGRLPYPSAANALGSRPGEEPAPASGGRSVLALAPSGVAFANGLVIMNVSANVSGPIPVPISAPFPTPSNGGASTAAPSADTATGPCGPALRLTAAHPDQAGAAWYARQVQVRPSDVAAAAAPALAGPIHDCTAAASLP